MKTNHAHLWLKAPLAVAGSVCLLLLLATNAPAAPLANSDDGAASSGLTAIDVSVEALPLIETLGMPHQGEARAGMVRAAATSEQLARLATAGVAFAAIGAVAIVEGGSDGGAQGPALAALCSQANEGDYAIPKLSYVYDPIFTNCAPSSTGATVGWVDIHFIVTNAYIGSYADGTRLSEIYVNLGRSSPTFVYTNIGETHRGICAPSGPPADGGAELAVLGTYDRWLFDVDATMGTNIFAGVPVDQRWDLIARHECTSSPQAYISYWGIWIYYTPVAPPTSTPTRTPTRTATAVPAWQFAGRVFDGNVGDESHPLNGVTVRLLCSNNQGEPGPQIASTTTDAAGWYGLSTSTICEYYNITETDPAGYSSVGATTVGGAVINANWIQYTYPVGGKTLTGNKFWDRRPTPTPTRTHGVLSHRIYCPIILKALD